MTAKIGITLSKEIFFPRNYFSRILFPGNYFSRILPLNSEINRYFFKPHCLTKEVDTMLESQPNLSNRALKTPRAAAITGGIPVIYDLTPAY